METQRSSHLSFSVTFSGDDHGCTPAPSGSLESAERRGSEIGVFSAAKLRICVSSSRHGRVQSAGQILRSPVY
jgi:hypothetical protein